MATKIIRRLCTKAKGPNVSPKDAKSAESGKSSKSASKNPADSKEVKKTDKKKPPTPNKTQPYCDPSRAYGKDLDPPKRVKVSLQGADCKAGEMATFLLKQHPLIKKIYLYGSKVVDDFATDLNLIDSNCRVESYSDETNLKHSLRAADIAVLIDVDRKDGNVKNKFNSSYQKVRKFAELCSFYCPRAIHILCVDPLCCMMPLMQRVFEETPFFHPAKLVGSIAPLQIRVNTLVARYLDLDPASVHVPLLGGPDPETVVPLLSSMTPDPGFCAQDQESFYDLIKKDIKFKDRMNHSTITEGYAIANIVNTVARGLCGHNDALTTAMVRTNCIPSIRYLVTTVRFGQGGICDNFGIPKLTRFELEKLEKAAVKLERRHNNIKRVLKAERNRMMKICCP